jgi:hypothetical protein
MRIEPVLASEPILGVGPVMQGDKRCPAMEIGISRKMMMFSDDEVATRLAS